jgi:hypothetical protein
MNLDHQAAVLQELGYYVFPVRDKKPLVSWRDESTREGDFDWSGATHVGIDCGKSGIAALDIDDMGQIGPLVTMWPQLARDWYQVTPRGGRHYLYRDGRGEVRNSAGAILPGIDVRGVGGYIVAYAPGDEFPDVRRLFGWPQVFTQQERVQAPAAATAASIGVVTQGGRNHAVTAHLGGFLKRCPAAGFDDVLAVARQYNQTSCSPPLPDDEVVAVANSAMRWGEDAKKAAKPPMFSFIGPLLELESGPPPRALCGTWLREGTLNVVSGRAGSGKTAVVAAMVAAMKRGKPFLGMPTQDPGRVLWINGDMPAWQVKERLSCLAGFADVDIAQAEMADLFQYEGELLELCKRYKLVVFDNRGTLLTVNETQREESWIPYQRLMHRITATGTTVIIQCHHNKSEVASVSGSEAQERTTTAMLSIHKVKDSDIRMLRYDKNRMGIESDQEFIIKADELGELHCLQAKDGAPAEVLPVIDPWRTELIGILSLRKVRGEVEPITKQVLAEQLANHFKVADRTASDKVQDLCAALVAEGRAEKHRVGKESAWKWK